YMAVRSMVDFAARVRRTRTSSVYCTPGVPRRLSSPTGMDSTREARGYRAVVSGMRGPRSNVRRGGLERTTLVLCLMSGEHGHEGFRPTTHPGAQEVIFL